MNHDRIRTVRWDEPCARKIWRRKITYFDPHSGTPVPKIVRKVNQPADRKTNRTAWRRRWLRVKLEEGRSFRVACAIKHLSEAKGGGVIAYVHLGHRQVAVRAASMRVVWRRVILAVEKILATEETLWKLTTSPAEARARDLDLIEAGW